MNGYNPARENLILATFMPCLTSTVFGAIYTLALNGLECTQEFLAPWVCFVLAFLLLHSPWLALAALATWAPALSKRLRLPTLVDFVNSDWLPLVGVVGVLASCSVASVCWARYQSGPPIILSTLFLLGSLAFLCVGIGDLWKRPRGSLAGHDDSDFLPYLVSMAAMILAAVYTFAYVEERWEKEWRNEWQDIQMAIQNDLSGILDGTEKTLEQPKQTPGACAIVAGDDYRLTPECGYLMGLSRPRSPEDLCWVYVVHTPRQYSLGYWKRRGFSPAYEYFGSRYCVVLVDWRKRSVVETFDVVGHNQVSPVQSSEENQFYPRRSILRELWRRGAKLAAKVEADLEGRK